MPGAIPHLIAGSIMFIIGRYYFKSYFDKKDKILLAIVCLIFSCLPDSFLAIYYTTHILSFEELLHYHILAHIIFTPLAVVGLLILRYMMDVKRKPVWIMGLWCILLHIVMDMFIPEGGVLI